MTAHEELLEAMQTLCCVYIEDFRNLHETLEFQDCKVLGKSVDLLLCNPPFNVRL